MSSVEDATCPSRVLQHVGRARKWSRQTGVPAALILAIIDQESDGDPRAERYEPNYTPSKLYKKDMDKAGVPERVQKTSYGLMQLMFPVAWGYWARNTEDLHDPDRNVRYGAAHLAALASHINKSGIPRWDAPLTVKEVAARYNGSTAKDKYAQDVYRLYNKYKMALEELPEPKIQVTRKNGLVYVENLARAKEEQKQ